jgi:glyoxylase-like metal-dependent hydrolase (beta-lactamase superfamily II)
LSIATTQICDHLSIVYGSNQGRFPFSHSFVVLDRICALIDTGSGHDTLKEISRSFKLDMVINSHAHPDHTAGNWIFDGIPVLAPIQGAETHGRLEPLSHRFFPDEALAARWRAWIAPTMGFRDHPPTDFFDDGHVFDFGSLRLRAVHTPGHTSDHYCFFEPDQRILLSFDLDLTPFGPWYGNHESSLIELRNSLDLVRQLDAQVVASSHLDPVTTDVESAFKDYVSVLDERESRLLELMDSDTDREALVEAAPIYGRHPYEPELLRWFEGRMIDLHLSDLQQRGLISSDCLGSWRRNQLSL